MGLQNGLGPAPSKGSNFLIRQIRSTDKITTPPLEFIHHVEHDTVRGEWQHVLKIHPFTILKFPSFPL